MRKTFALALALVATCAQGGEDNPLANAFGYVPPPENTARLWVSASTSLLTPMGLIAQCPEEVRCFVNAATVSWEGDPSAEAYVPVVKPPGSDEWIVPSSRHSRGNNAATKTTIWLDQGCYALRIVSKGPLIPEDAAEGREWRHEVTGISGEMEVCVLSSSPVKGLMERYREIHSTYVNQWRVLDKAREKVSLRKEIMVATNTRTDELAWERAVVEVRTQDVHTARALNRLSDMRDRVFASLKALTPIPLDHLRQPPAPVTPTKSLTFH